MVARLARSRRLASGRRALPCLRAVVDGTSREPTQDVRSGRHTAALVLGCPAWTDGAAADVEPALEWLNTIEAADTEILGVTPRRVRQLVQRGLMPEVRRGNRSYYYFRRAQVEVIANARRSRKLR